MKYDIIKMICKAFAFPLGYNNRFLWFYYTDFCDFVPILFGQKSRFSKKYFYFPGSKPILLREKYRF